MRILSGRPYLANSADRVYYGDSGDGPRGNDTDLTVSKLRHEAAGSIRKERRWSWKIRRTHSVSVPVRILRPLEAESRRREGLIVILRSRKFPGADRSDDDIRVRLTDTQGSSWVSALCVP